jgi:N-acetyltransferase
VRLEPLRDAHLDALHAAIGSAAVFAGGYGGGPAGLPADASGFRDFARRYYAFGVGNPYAVLVHGGPHDDEVVGTSTLADFDEAGESCHLGWTAYDPRVWGTQVNPATKALLLGLAFDAGFGRVKLQADVRNTRSRAAIERLGATFEGVTRRDKPRADGTWRDTAVYSILADEWPGVRAGLERRLERWAGRPVLFRSARDEDAGPQPGARSGDEPGAEPGARRTPG